MGGQHVRALPDDLFAPASRAEYPHGAVFSPRRGFADFGTPGMGGPGEPRLTVSFAAESPFRRPLRLVGKRRGALQVASYPRLSRQSECQVKV